MGQGQSQSAGDRADFGKFATSQPVIKAVSGASASNTVKKFSVSLLHVVWTFWPEQLDRNVGPKSVLFSDVLPAG